MLCSCQRWQQFRDIAESKSYDSSDDENCSNDDVIVGNFESAQKKPKTFASALQLHNYFSLPVRMPTAEKKINLAKDSDLSHVMRQMAKLAVFVGPALKRTKLGVNFTIETED